MSDTSNNTNNREEKLIDNGISVQNESLKKIENFFYYNKFKLLAVILVLAVLLICILQSCENEKVDSFILYSGPYMLQSSDNAGMKNAFNAVMPDDFDKDGEKRTHILTTYILSQEQIASIEAETDADGEKLYTVDKTFNISELSQFDNLILTGEYSICLLDPFLYERVKASGGFRMLTEIMDDVPDCAIDEYGIEFKKTEFAQYYDVFDQLPDDTILCLRTPGTIGTIGGNNKISKEYDFSVKFFRAIVEFIPE